MTLVFREKELYRFLHGLGVEVLEGGFFDFEGTPVRPPHLAYLLVLIDGGVARVIRPRVPMPHC